MGVKENKIYIDPTEYPYLENANGSYTSTGYTPALGFGFELEFSLPEDYKHDIVYFGNDLASTTQCVRLMTSWVSNKLRLILRTGLYTKNYDITSYVANGLRHKVELTSAGAPSGSNSIIKIDGTTLGSDVRPISSGSKDSSILINAHFDTTKTTPVICKSDKAKIHSFKIIEYGNITKTTVHWYVPSKRLNYYDTEDETQVTHSGNQYVYGVVCESNLSFSNEDVMSLSTVKEMSITAAELAYDTMEVNVHYEEGTPEIIRSMTDDGTGWMEGITTSDGYILSGKYGTDIRITPYGTKILHYYDDGLHGRFYLDSVDRTSKYDYKLNCISAVGLLDKQYHRGGIYFGSTFGTILADIIGTSFDYTVDSGLSSEKIYGWLPYDTKRNNLRQLLFAVNAHVSKDDNLEPKFCYIDDDNIGSIDVDNVYDSGSEEYPRLASKVTVKEHTYFYNASVEEVKVFDNSSNILGENKWVQFENAPINVSTLSTTGDITVSAATPNGCVINGIGTIYGKPYTHNEFDVVRTSQTNQEEYEVTVTDATLVTVANSENVADRIMSYYSSANKINVGIVENGETVGSKYAVTDAFWEARVGWMSKMQETLSSFIKAECELIDGFDLGAEGNNFSNSTILSSGTSYTVPAGVTKIRAVLIGGGSGGQGGTAGKAGSNHSGGTGGKGGTAGKGGKICIREFDVTPGSSISYSIGAGGSGGSATYSTENHSNGSDGGATVFNGVSTSTYGARIDGGIKDMFKSENAVYGAVGHDGIDGGKGGSSSSGGSEAGEGVSYSFYRPDGTFVTASYNGGSHGTDVHVEVVGTVDVSGGSGGGASATGAGTNGTDSSSSSSPSSRPGSLTTISTVDGHGGAGSSPSKATSATYFGCGGDGGHGGGGGGGYGQTSNNVFFYSESTPYDGTFYYGYDVSETTSTHGNGGLGGAGGDGKQGCIILYY